VPLTFHRGGSGEPLLLVHGIGSQWQVWRPVLDALAAEREVVAIDLPGFGGSPPFPDDVEPSPEALAGAVSAFLDELGWERPHVAGNSLGGWIALELAKTGRARSACALSPAGWWNRWERTYATVSLRNARAGAVAIQDHVDRLYASPGVRRAALAQMTAHGERMPAEEAAAAMRNLAASPGFEATLDAMSQRHFTGASAVTGVPVTVAWAERDRLLLPRQAARARAALPAARHVTLFGCGHVPTWDDPALVARTILSSG
jgi:pimeloyl-ACP methyl ester carboxylesterase